MLLWIEGLNLGNSEMKATIPTKKDIQGIKIRFIKFMHENIFWKETFWKLAADIFTLLLVTFVSKLVNYSSHREESLKNDCKSTNRHYRRKRLPFSNSYECSNTHCALNDWTMWTQQVPKKRKGVNSWKLWD